MNNLGDEARSGGSGAYGALPRLQPSSDLRPVQPLRANRTSTNPPIPRILSSAECAQLPTPRPAGVINCAPSRISANGTHPRRSARGWHQRGPRADTCSRPSLPLLASRVPLAVVKRRPPIWPGDAGTVRCRRAAARVGRWGTSARPTPAGRDRSRDRPSRARSSEALDRGWVWPTARAGRPRAAGRCRVTRAAAERDAHRCGGHATQVCRAGGAIADGVLLNGCCPLSGVARQWVLEGAARWPCCPLSRVRARCCGPCAPQGSATRKQVPSIMKPIAALRGHGCSAAAASGIRMTRSEVPKDWRRTTLRSIFRSRGLLAAQNASSLRAAALAAAP